jgi:hypothetical protein
MCQQFYISTPLCYDTEFCQIVFPSRFIPSFNLASKFSSFIFLISYFRFYVSFFLSYYFHFVSSSSFLIFFLLLALLQLFLFRLLFVVLCSCHFSSHTSLRCHLSSHTVIFCTMMCTDIISLCDFVVYLTMLSHYLRSCSVE